MTENVTTELTLAERSAAVRAAKLAIDVERAEALVALSETEEYQSVVEALSGIHDPDEQGGSLNAAINGALLALKMASDQGQQTIAAQTPDPELVPFPSPAPAA